jgi:hypothetical protein
LTSAKEGRFLVVDERIPRYETGKAKPAVALAKLLMVLYQHPELQKVRGA